VVAVKGPHTLFGRFVSLFSARIGTTVLAILTTPIVSRLLGPGRYGDYAVMLAVFSIWMIPVSSAITQGVQKYVAEVRDAPNWQENVIRFYGTVAVILGLVGGGCLLAFVALGGPVLLFGPDFALYFVLLVGLVLASQFRALTQHVVLGYGLEHVSGPIDIAKKALTVVVGIGLVVFFGFGVDGMLAGHIVAELTVAVFAAAVITRRVSLGALLRSTPNAFPVRELLSFNGQNVVLVLLVMSLYHVDVLMLRSMAGSQTTGWYKAALSLAEYVWAAPKALQMVLLHTSSTLWSEDRRDEITNLATRISRYTLLLVLLLAIGLGSLADAVVPLYYGEDFAVAATPLLLLLPGVVGFAVARPLQAIGQGSGRLRTLILAGGVAAGINLALNALLIPRFGMYGAAVATSTSYGSMLVCMVWAARRIGFDPLADVRIGRIVATAVGSAVPILGLVRSIDSNLVALLVVPPVGLVVYTVLAVVTGAVTDDEVRTVLRKTPDPFGTVLEAGFVKLQ